MNGTAVRHVPSGVQALTETRLSTLDRTVQRVLFLAAAANSQEIPMDALRAGAAALDPPVGDGPLLEALDDALETGLLEERRTGYAFRHPLVRRAVYERMSRHGRAQLGDVLHRSGERCT
jgi:predicted ATPase